MAIDLNTKPWYVAGLVGLVLGVATFVVMHIYVFKPIKTDITRLEEKIDDLEREIEKGRAAKADLPRLEDDLCFGKLGCNGRRGLRPGPCTADGHSRRHAMGHAGVAVVGARRWNRGAQAGTGVEIDHVAQIGRQWRG